MAAMKVRRPEDLSVGEWVHIVVPYGQDGALIKRKRAKVSKVLRKAAVLTDIEGEQKQRTVRFNELELIAPEPQAQPQPAVRRRRTSRRKEQKHLRAVPAAFTELDEKDEEDKPQVIRRPASATGPLPSNPEPVSEPEPSPPPPATESPLDYDSWVAKGASIQAQLIERSHALDDEVREIMAEQLAVEEKLEGVKKRLAEKEEELQKLRNKIALLESLEDLA